MSHITTHILDTTKGRPAAGVAIILSLQHGNEWDEIAKGVTNADGRITDLLRKDLVLPEGIYKMKFDTKPYFEKQAVATFYPFVEIVFTITGNEHYHIPLLISAYGYSTYRGS